MKAVLVKEQGGTEQMQLVEVEKPKAKEDISLGLEVSGIIEEVGNANSNYKVGDEVCGLMPEGGYAEYALLREDIIIPKPENLTFNEAAAIPEVFMTAYQTLFWLGK